MNKRTRITIRRAGLVLLVSVYLLWGNPLQPARAITTWAVGDVFVAVGNEYQVYDNAGNFKEKISDGLGNQNTGCAFNPVFNKLYTTNISFTKVIVFDEASPHNILQTIDTNVTSPGGHSESIVFDAAGNFYVGHADGNRLIHKYDAAGTLLATFNAAVDKRGTDWLDLAVDQRTMFYTSEGRQIKRFDVASNVQLPDFANLGTGDEAYALRLLPPGDGSGGLLVADTLDIKRLDGSGTVVQTYDAAGEDGWFSLALDINGTSFWAGNFGPYLYRFNIATGAIEIGPIRTGGVHGICVKGQPPPTLKVIKHVVNDNGGTAAASDFTMTVTGNSPSLATFPGDESGTTVTLNPGTYSVTETGPGGYTASFSADCSGSIVAGLTKTCTVTNDDQVAPADLSITKTDAPDPVVPGGALTYDLTVVNNGPGDATGVMVTDTLPAAVTFDPATSTPGCTQAGGVVTCAIGNLANGASATFTINVTVDPAAPPGTIMNAASVSGAETDPNLGDNTATTDTTVTPPASVCTILDDFNRPDGSLGSNWADRTRGYRIKANQAVVRRGGPIYWQPEAYGPDQEACVTLTRINPKSRQHALLLKVQELNNWRKGAILVSYNARSGNVEVKARDVANHKWILVGSFTPPTPVVEGDQLRAKAYADSTVEVFINNTSIGTADAGSFYVEKGGQIGLWFRGRQGEGEDNDDDHDRLVQAREHEDDDDEEDDDGGSGALRGLLDDFGGGTLPPP